MQAGEFYGLTPVEFFSIFKAWEAKERRDALRLARLQLTIATASGAQSLTGEPLTVYDFVPHLRPPTPPATSETLERQFLSCLPTQWHPPPDLSAVSSSTSKLAPPS